jgi:putative spermidine/putrescine transport system substrate-binding protein
MRRCLIALVAMMLVLQALPAGAQDKLVVSIWGGSWRDLVAATAAKKFTEATGVAVEFITGGTIDRLNKAKLAKGSPESDLNFTTSHVGWLYANDDLYEKLDLAKIPNAGNLVEQAKISPWHIGTWAYVYTIGSDQRRGLHELGRPVEAGGQGQARGAGLRPEPSDRRFGDAVGR